MADRGGGRAPPPSTRPAATPGTLHFQHRVENSWEANARDVAGAVAGIAAAESIELVVVTGDPRARTLLIEHLQSGLRAGTEVVSAQAGGREPGPGAPNTTRRFREAVLQHDWLVRRAMLEHLQQNVGREHYGVVGVGPVVEALRAAAVNTLVVSDDPSSTLRAFVEPQPTQFGLTADELDAMGGARRERGPLRQRTRPGGRRHRRPIARDAERP